MLALTRETAIADGVSGNGIAPCEVAGEHGDAPASSCTTTGAAAGAGTSEAADRAVDVDEPKLRDNVSDH